MAEIIDYLNKNGFTELIYSYFIFYCIISVLAFIAVIYLFIHVYKNLFK